MSTYTYNIKTFTYIVFWALKSEHYIMIVVPQSYVVVSKHWWPALPYGFWFPISPLHFLKLKIVIIFFAYVILETQNICLANTSLGDYSECLNSLEIKISCTLNLNITNWNQYNIASHFLTCNFLVIFLLFGEFKRDKWTIIYIIFSSFIFWRKVYMCIF